MDWKGPRRKRSRTNLRQQYSCLEALRKIGRDLEGSGHVPIWDNNTVASRHFGKSQTTLKTAFSKPAVQSVGTVSRVRGRLLTATGCRRLGRTTGTGPLPYMIFSGMGFNYLGTGIFRKSVEKIQVSLKSDTNKRYCTWRPTCVQFRSCRAQFFLEWEMFHTKVVEKVKTRVLFLIIFFRKSCRLRGNVEKMGHRKRGHTWQCDMALRRCDLHVATTTVRIQTDRQTHCVTLIALSLQEWWRKRVSVFRYTYCAILINTIIAKTDYTQYGADTWQGCSVVSTEWQATCVLNCIHTNQGLVRDGGGVRGSAFCSERVLQQFCFT
jgi:hypothetical protein